jgi:hypothetical protein
MGSVLVFDFSIFVASLLQRLVMVMMRKNPRMSDLLSATGTALASHATHEVPGHLGNSRVVL